MATQLLKTVMPSGGDYTSLEACMNANEQNLVTADKYFDVKIDGTWSSADTTVCTIHNYTTDVTRYINIYTTSAARHAGVWNTGKYILSTTPGYNNFAIELSVDYVSIKGLQITIAPSSAQGRGIGWGSTSTTFAYNLVRRSGGSSAGGDLVLLGASSIAYNNIVYNGGGNGMFTSSDGVCFYNNTVYGCAVYGIRGTRGSWGGNITYKNNIGQSNSTGNISQYNYATVTDTTNLTNNSVTFVSTTGGSEDFHLTLGSGGIDGGTDLSATFTDDIDGVTRTGTWDIGADEYVAAGTLYYQTCTDSTTFTDTPTKFPLKSLLDISTLTSLLNKLAMLQRDEAIAVSDTFTWMCLKELTDTTTTSDTFTKLIRKLLSDTTNFTSSLSKLVMKLINETVTLTDSITSLKLALLLLTEITTVSDTLTKLTQKQITDITTFSTTFTKLIQLLKSETITLTESVHLSSLLLLSLTETTTLTTSLLKYSQKLLAETNTCTDSISKYTMLDTLQEVMTLIDLLLYWHHLSDKLSTYVEQTGVGSSWAEQTGISSTYVEQTGISSSWTEQAGIDTKWVGKLE